MQLVSPTKLGNLVMILNYFTFGIAIASTQPLHIFILHPNLEEVKKFKCQTLNFLVFETYCIKTKIIILFL